MAAKKVTGDVTNSFSSISLLIYCMNYLILTMRDARKREVINLTCYFHFLMKTRLSLRTHLQVARRAIREHTRGWRVERSDRAAPPLYKAVQTRDRGQLVHGICQGNPCSSVDRKPLQVRADLVELRNISKSRRE